MLGQSLIFPNIVFFLGFNKVILCLFYFFQDSFLGNNINIIFYSFFFFFINILPSLSRIFGAQPFESIQSLLSQFSFTISFSIFYGLFCFRPCFIAWAL